MLDVLNRYAHGFVVVAVTLACRRGKVFDALRAGPRTAEDLSTALAANSGHLQVALRLFESLGWIDRDAERRYYATPLLAQQQLIPDDAWTLLDVDMDDYLRRGDGKFWGPWLERVAARWGVADPLIADFLDSLLVVPVMALLTKREILRQQPAKDFADLPNGVRDEVVKLLQLLGWLEGPAGRRRLTPPGEFMFERAMNLGVAESYRTMLVALDELLFGNAAAVFALRADGHENHVDRTMNVLASGHMHDRYFAEVEQMLISIFSREPWSSQPRYVADMGSGDGTFLKRVYQTVRDKTPRGQRLAEFPLTMIGIDLNQASLDATSRTLRDIQHVVVTGDIGNPKGVAASLQKLGVDPAAVLHIRSFLDHDRPYIAPADRETLAAREAADYHGVYVERSGRAIPPAAAVQSLVEHLQRWSDIVTEHGFILLEVHCQEPLVVRAHLDESESLYFDAIEAFSHQLLIEADAALLAAAEAGLFPRREYFRKFPGFMPYCRITLNLFERRPYRVRFARGTDLPELTRLEEACWPAGMRVSPGELRRRIDVYPLGQWVVELDGEIVAVVYSQRVKDIEQLRSAKLADVGALRNDQGSVVQLLGLNVLPEKQHLGLGDQLLDLMLMRSALQGGVRRVAGLTRCKDFHGRSHEELAAYVAARDALGAPLDPILQFHHSHGAQLLGPVAGYRPEDTANLGAGILLCYELGAPGSGTQIGASSTASADAAPSVERCLRVLLGAGKQDAFARDRPLREMGLDSLALLEFRTLLQQAFGRTLSPTFFFSYSTVEKIEKFFGDSAPPALRPEIAAPAAVSLVEPSRVEQRIAAPTKSGPEVRSPIAVIGMAARFPGADNVAAYWQLLEAGVDAISEIPSERWDRALYSADRDAPGKIVSRHGGFLRKVDEFDAAFFAVAPPEARLMDPQQRLLLEIHWEALEHAGVDPNRLRETDCGFFVGLSSHDYETLQVRDGSDEDLGAYFATGNSAAIAAGRLAYFFGTTGAAMTIDTACSSSLVAVHQAIQSLRSGECTLALASGVSLMLSPHPSIAFSKAGMLSPDGRCRTFDASANGYVRSEGCAAVVLKRLDDAVRDGDHVLAVLRGSAINQDGASNGLTAPSLPSQQKLLRRALRDAGLQAADIDYVEAHGTGTSLGDPVEFDALRDVFGGDAARVRPFRLGSVKTNIGHTEAAAGLAGLIKVVLAMNHGRLPAHLHFRTPNPHIDLASVPASIPTETIDWRGSDRPLRAGVSAFGFSGTNAHVVIEQSLAPARASPLDRQAHVLPLSAKSPAALQASIAAYGQWLAENSSANFADVCHTAAVGRAQHGFRRAFVGRTIEELKLSLRTVRAQGSAVRGAAPRVAFLFTGQGSQYADMARELAVTEPVFRAVLAECREILRDELDAPLEDILYPPAGRDSRLDETANTQPALFAIEYALARTLQAWGVTPVAVMGHSVGEYVAACIAGVFTLRDGLKLIAARGRLMGSLPMDGAMAAVLAPSALARQALAGQSDVVVAAYNGPENTVLSGRRNALDSVCSALERAGTKVVQLQVSHAFHSPLMAPILPAFKEIARWVKFSAPEIPLISNVTGRLATVDVATPDYWTRHISEPVLFESGMRALFEQGIDVVLEVGPHPVLLAMGRNCVPATTADAARWIPTLARGAAAGDAMAGALAALFESGVAIDWQARDSGFPRNRVSLPTYPWERKRHWYRNRSELVMAPGVEAAIDNVFEPRWVARSLRDEPGTLQPAERLPAWLVVADRHGVGEELARLVRAGGAACQLLVAPSGKVLDTAVQELRAVAGGCLIVDCRPCDTTPESSAAGVLDTASRIGSAAAAVLRTAAGKGVEAVWFVTCGAQPVQAGENVAVAAATLWGFANVARAEYPNTATSMVDLDPTAKPNASAAALYAEVLSGARASRVAQRAGQRFVLGLVPLPTSGMAAPVAPVGTYLVVGGMGELGLHTAKWLVQRGATRVVLAGRTLLPPAAAKSGADPSLAARMAVVAELESAGAKLRFATLDVCDQQQITALLATLRAEGWGPIRGVVHTAAVIADQSIADLDDAAYRRVLAPKVAGTLSLAEALRDESLDFFLLYSSVGSLIGLPGQASYAAANAFLDAFAATLRARGVPALSINWCGWQDTGLARTLGGRRAIARLAELGIGAVTSVEALAVLDRVVGVEAAGAAVLPLGVPSREAGAADDVDPLIAVLSRGYGTEPSAESGPAAPTHANLFDGRSGDELTAAITATVVSSTAELLGVAAATIDFDRPLGELGIDSLLGIELRKILQKRSGVALSVALAWNHPTVRSVITHLVQRVSNSSVGGSAPSAKAPGAVPPPASHDSVDLEGMSDEEALRRLTGRG